MAAAAIDVVEYWRSSTEFGPRLNSADLQTAKQDLDPATEVTMMTPKTSSTPSIMRVFVSRSSSRDDAGIHLYFAGVLSAGS
jgi:hypothetical protein